MNLVQRLRRLDEKAYPVWLQPPKGSLKLIFYDCLLNTRRQLETRRVFRDHGLQ